MCAWVVAMAGSAGGVIRRLAWGVVFGLGLGLGGDALAASLAPGEDVAVAVLAPAAAASAPRPAARRQQHVPDLVVEQAQFIDRTGRVTVDTIAQQPFEPVQAPAAFFGFQKDPVWLRLRLRPSNGRINYWLSLWPPATYAATLYQPDDAGGWRALTQGSRYAHSQGPVDSLGFIFPLALKPGEATTVYVRLDTATPTAKVRVVPLDQALAIERTMGLVFASYFGLASIALVVSLLAYVATRQALWLSTAAYDISTVGLTLIQSGIARTYLAPDAEDLINRLHPAAATLVLCMAFNLYAHMTRVVGGPTWVRQGLWVGMLVPPATWLLMGPSQALAVQSAVAVCGPVWALALFFVKTDFDPVTVRCFRAVVVVQLLYALAFLGPWHSLRPVAVDALHVSPSMPANLLSMALGLTVAFRLSLLDGRARKRLQRQARVLKRRRAAALADSQAKSAFLAYMSHEIRTPLAGVVGLAELASAPDASPAARDDYLHLLKESASSLTSVISDVLDLSKIEAGKLDMEVVDFDLNDWLDALHATHFALAQRKGLHFEIERRGLQPGVVRGDAIRMRQIVGNFLSNALKFTREGEVRLTAERRAPGRYRFEVRDTGRGLTADEQARLFQAYVQADGDQLIKAGGTGLGLAISRELARLMGGDVGVHSQHGQGSRFWLDVALPEAAGPATAARRAPDYAHALNQRRVLVAEDDDMNRVMLEALLRREGAQPVGVASGEAAVAAVCEAHAAGTPFDIGLLDIHMQGIGGLEAVRRIRALGAAGGFPILALTGSALAQDRQNALSAGMNDVITKPVLVSRLREAVHLHMSATGVAGPRA